MQGTLSHDFCIILKKVSETDARGRFLHVASADRPLAVERRARDASAFADGGDAPVRPHVVAHEPHGVLRHRIRVPLCRLPQKSLELLDKRTRHGAAFVRGRQRVQQTTCSRWVHGRADVWKVHACACAFSVSSTVTGSFSLMDNSLFSIVWNMRNASPSILYSR